MQSVDLDSASVSLVGAPRMTVSLTQTLCARGWECTSYETTSGLLPRIRSESGVDLVVLVPDKSIESDVEFCRQVKFDKRTAFVCVIFVLPGGSSSDRLRAYGAGANDCIDANALSDEFFLRVTNALRAKRATDTLEDAASLLTSLAVAIEGRDVYTRGHVERVAIYSVEIGKRLGLSGKELGTLRFGAILHDIGKVNVPDAILNKPGKLDDEEMEIIRRHPVIGYDILKPSKTFRDVLPIVRWHHERPNGNGYPDGIAGDELSILPRIVAAADVFDALATTRPYRPALPPWKCHKILHDMVGNGDLDVMVVDALTAIYGASHEALGVGPEQTVHD